MNDPNLLLYTSNRMEELVGFLSRALTEGERADPFCAETILVQSRGMARWLSLRLAEENGVCFNMHFPFPRDVVEDLIKALLPDWGGAQSLRREVLVWRIFDLLGAFRHDERFGPITRYLENDHLLKRMQLADRVAGIFDEYMVYRPDWLVEWEEKEDEDHWQAVLWRELIRKAGGETHLSRAWWNLRTESRAIAAGAAPSRLFVFGISSLPPLFLDVFSAYAREREVHLFLLQPTNQYWGDLVSRKERARRLLASDGRDEFLSEGHPLVSSMGRQGQDLLNLLIDGGYQTSDAREAFIEADGGSLLHALQNEILGLEEQPDGENGRRCVEPEDRSIQIHSCHSPMREVEVLHDQLLDLFEADPTLQPRDVLVMIPDVEAYAPYVQAVFGGSGPAGRIPFRVVDRRPRSEFRAVDAWFRLLELAGGRFGAREVMAMIETPAFMERFALADRDVNMLRAWIQATGIRWGVDAAHREAEGLPALDETTWENGLRQWLLGSAMRERIDGEHSCFAGIFPFDEMEGGNLVLLEKALQSLGFLFRARDVLSGRRCLADWIAVARDLLDDFLAPVESVAREVEAIRGALRDLAKAGQTGGATEFTLDVFRYALDRGIDATVSGGGFLSGGVTFCALQPMRTIPARVVCLLGMNDPDFPRRQQQLGFDRMRERRRVGDRSPREDDRYLFLETLLSVRDALILSYVGQSARDLSESPPSVVLSELLDHLDATYVFGGGRTARQAIVTRHRLQAFHPDYFGEGPLFSYSKENAEASVRLLSAPAEPPGFVDAALPETGEEEVERSVSVGQLVRFFRHPAEFFVRNRLGLQWAEEGVALEDAESFTIDPLDRYALKQESVQATLVQRESSGWAVLQARGRVPLGDTGVAACREVEGQARRFAARVGGEVALDADPSNQAIDVRIGDYHLRGDIGPFHGGKLVFYRAAKLKAKDYIAAWICHLCAGLHESSVAVESVLIGEDKTEHFSAVPVAEAERIIYRLLQLYEQGTRRPLPFFPESSLAFARSWAKGEDKARGAARTAFQGGLFRGAEEDDRAISLCWSGANGGDPLGEEFEAIAMDVFGAMSLGGK